MGAVSFSLDIRMVEFLQEVLPLSIFVETGTFEGDSVASLLSRFSEIYTVDLSEPYYARAVERFHSSNWVVAYNDDSPRVLASLHSRLCEASVLYWLDAHWCGVETIGNGRSHCPLLAELEAIGTLNSQSVVLIDDARLFLCTPPAPHETNAWPRFDEVLATLRNMSDRHEIMVINDVIAFFPTAIGDSVAEYAKEHSIDWLSSLVRLKALEEDHEQARLASDELRAEQEMLRRVLAERLQTIEGLKAEQEMLHEVLSARLKAIEELTEALRSARLSNVRRIRRGRSD